MDAPAPQLRDDAQRAAGRGRDWSEIHAVALVIGALVAVSLLVREQGATWAWLGVAYGVASCAVLYGVWRVAEWARIRSFFIALGAVAGFVALSLLGRGPDVAGVVHLFTKSVVVGTGLWLILSEIGAHPEPARSPGRSGTIRSQAHEDRATARRAWLDAGIAALAALPLLRLFLVSDSRVGAHAALALLALLLVVAACCARGSEWARMVGGIAGVTIGAVLIAYPELLQFSWRPELWRYQFVPAGPILLGFHLLRPATRERFRAVREARERIRIGELATRAAARTTER